MKRMLTVLAAVISAVVSQMAMAAVSFTISADKTTADFAFDATNRMQVLYFVYGNVDAGDATNGWEHVAKLADIASDATEAKGIALPPGCGTDWAICRAIISIPMTAADYCRPDDLLVQYDGLENAGFGVHQANLTAWKDLRGDHDLPLVGTDSVNADSVLIGNTIHAANGGDVVATAQRMTFEANARPDSGDYTVDDKKVYFARVYEVGYFGWVTGTDRGGIITYRRLTSGSSMYYRYSDCGYGSLAELASVRVFQTYSATLENGYNACYINGVSVAAKSNVTSGTQAKGLSLYVGAENSSNVTTLMRSLRIYRGELTQAERLLNTRIDAERFENGPLVLACASSVKMISRPLAVKKFTKDGLTPISADLEFTGTNFARRLYIAWGRKDSGTTPEDWGENKAEIEGGVPAGVSALTVAIPSAVRADARYGVRFFLSIPATAADYRRPDDLVVQYDGLENAGFGVHQANLTAWKDLRGDHDLPLVGTDSVNADSVLIGNTAHTANGGDVIDTPQRMTFEANVRPNGGSYSSSALFSWFAWIKSVGSFGWITGDNYGGIITRRDLSSGSGLYVKCLDCNYGNLAGLANAQVFQTYSATLEKGYSGACRINGESAKAAKSTPTSTAQTAASLALIVGNNSSSGVTTLMRSLRIYRGELTAADELFNARIDAERFEGGEPVLFEAADFVKPNKFGLIIVVE